MVKAWGARAARPAASRATSVLRTSVQARACGEPQAASATAGLVKEAGRRAMGYASGSTRDALSRAPARSRASAGAAQSGAGGKGKGACWARPSGQPDSKAAGTLSAAAGARACAVSPVEKKEIHAQETNITVTMTQPGKICLDEPGSFCCGMGARIQRMP